MQSVELDALIEQISNNYRNSWEQTRLIASAMGADGIKFPWDTAKTQKTITPEELKSNAQKFFEHLNEIEKTTTPEELKNNTQMFIENYLKSKADENPLQ